MDAVRLPAPPGPYDAALYASRLVRELRDPGRLREVARAPYDGPWRERARTLVALAAQMLRTEIAQVNLVTDTALRVLASATSAPYEVPVEVSYCQHVVGTGGSVVVYDSSADPLVQASPTAPRLRAYLGIPLTHRGQVLGALCVAQAEPRDWTDTEVCLLTELTATLLTGDGWVA